jgi:hypothetical protein
MLKIDRIKAIESPELKEGDRIITSYGYTGDFIKVCPNFEDRVHVVLDGDLSYSCYRRDEIKPKTAGV